MSRFDKAIRREKNILEDLSNWMQKLRLTLRSTGSCRKILTDEMVKLARQLKESSLMMNQSVQQTEKILDSVERAVEHSLASTGRATSRAAEVYSLTSKTTCFQWLLLFVMTCMFVMVVLLIRIT